jgi:hypothetical protein
MSEETTETTEPTLNDVYSQYNVQAQAQEFKEQTKPAAAPAAIPDQVLDPDGFNHYMTTMNANHHEMEQNMSSQLDAVNQQLSALSESQTVADISNAVDSLAKHADGIDKSILEGQLNLRASKDPLFMSLWRNRQANPEAFNNGLAALGREISSKMPTVNPQTAEAQQALLDAAQSSGTEVDTSEADSKYSSMEDGAFLNEMNALAESG